MRVKKVWAVYFSGTGTTEKTVRRIAAGMAQALDAELAVYDFTTPAARQRELRFNAEELAVLGVPVYAGRVPNVLLPYLTKQLHGGGALAVPVVLFGNRNFDDGLIELRNILTEDGFMPVAGGAQKYPFPPDRPRWDAPRPACGRRRARPRTRRRPPA